MKRYGVLAAVIFAISVLAGCGTNAVPESERGRQHTEAPEAGTTNPRKGWVYVWGDDSLQKRCDGTTLVYWMKDGYGGGLDTTPNSPECKK